MNRDLSDGALIEAACAGSSAAYGLLVRRHQGLVRGFLRRVLGNHADADDLAQDVFVTAWSRLSAFRGETRLSVWLCGIAYRKALTWQRSSRRRALRETAVMQSAETVCRPDESTRLDAARALAGLDPAQRAVISLCLAADFSHSEAAAALNLPLGTIKSHVQRGRAKLLESLGDRDDGN